MNATDLPDAPQAFAPAPAPPEPPSLRDALHGIRATGRLNTGDREGYVSVLRQMAEAFGEVAFAEHADTIEAMRRGGAWLAGWSADWIVPEPRTGALLALGLALLAARKRLRG